MQKTDNQRRWQHKPFVGISLMILGLALYPLSDALLKHLMGTYSVNQTSFLRSAMRCVPLLIAVYFQGGFKKVFSMQQKKLHAIRLTINLGYTYLFMLSFSLASLTAVYTLSYTSSLFMVLLGFFFLKETVSKEKWIAVFLGMCGVLIALRPSSNCFTIASFMVLFATFLGAFNKVCMRKLASTEHSLAIAIYPNVCMLLCLSPWVIPNWQPMSFHDWLYFLGVGVVTAAAQFSVAQALRFAQASRLAPIDYSSFLWVLLLDFLCFQGIPDRFTLIGAALIIISNLCILYTTRKEEKSVCPKLKQEKQA